METEHTSAEPDRVRRRTAPEVLDQIDRQIEARVRFYAKQSHEAITRHIEELDREWDMERMLGTNAATLALTGAVLGLTVNRKWLLLTCGVTGFLLQHALTGWCPPVPVFRRLGIRTRSEIDREKFALKGLRGDFRDLPEPRQEIDPAVAGQILQTISR